MPLLINTFGSLRRMELAFEVERLDDVAARIQGFLKMETPQGLFDKIKMLPKLAELGSFFPKSVKSGPCKEVICKGADVNLLEFPILKCWPQDGGRFITFPLVFTKNPETGKRNVGMYRMQVYDRAHDRDALADAEAWRGTFSAGACSESAMGRLLWRWRLAPTRPRRWQACCRFRRTWTK